MKERVRRASIKESQWNGPGDEMVFNDHRAPNGGEDLCSELGR